MKPDTYKIRNPANPATALAAWMQLAGIGRNALAKKAEVSEQTVSSAMHGGAIRKGSAELIAKATGLDAGIVMARLKMAEWTFTVHGDGAVDAEASP